MEDAVEYGRRIHYVENVAYSKMGSWGMLFSQEDHAVLACTPALMKELEIRIPNMHDQVYQFLELWKGYQEHYKMEYPWLQPLLIHVYGDKKGTELFEWYNKFQPDII